MSELDNLKQTRLVIKGAMEDLNTKGKEAILTVADALNNVLAEASDVVAMTALSLVSIEMAIQLEQQ